MSRLLLLATAAAGVGAVHTLLGPDHYLPFVVLGRARGWTARRTAGVTLACGVAHLASALLIGLGGIALGVAVSRLAWLESVRGSLTAWLLIAIGSLYAAWGLHRALRGDRHVHAHPHPVAHAHPHDARRDHAHEHHHEAPQEWRSLTPWALFVVFVLGPCEPLVPLVMVPAAAGSAAGVAVVAAVFSATTLVVMVAAVLVARLGVDLVPLGRLERYTHALAGSAICLSGIGIRLLGW